MKNKVKISIKCLAAHGLYSTCTTSSTSTFNTIIMWLHITGNNLTVTKQLWRWSKTARQPTFAKCLTWITTDLLLLTASIHYTAS